MLDESLASASKGKHTAMALKWLIVLVVKHKASNTAWLPRIVEETLADKARLIEEATEKTRSKPDVDKAACTVCTISFLGCKGM